MDLDWVQSNLKLARRHVSEAETRLEMQRVRIRRLGDAGHSGESLAVAARLLQLFERTLDVMQQHLATEEELVASLMKKRDRQP